MFGRSRVVDVCGTCPLPAVFDVPFMPPAPSAALHISISVLFCTCSCSYPFSALTLLVGQQEGIRPVKTEWWGAGVVVCLEQGAVLHMAQLMPLPLTVSCFSKIQIGFIFLVPAHPGSPGKKGH